MTGDCHTASAISQCPSVITGQPGSTLCPGNIRRGLAAPQGALMTSVVAHSYRTAQRLDSCQVEQQVLADIGCNLSCVRGEPLLMVFTASAVITYCMIRRD